MAIIIVDDSVMVYSPVALSWEEVPEQIDFPNGFIGGRDMASSLLRQIEGEPIEINIEGMNIAIQSCPIVQKAPKEIKQEIETTISVLKENPPITQSINQTKAAIMLNSCVLTGNVCADPEILIFNSCKSIPLTTFNFAIRPNEPPDLHFP